MITEKDRSNHFLSLFPVLRSFFADSLPRLIFSTTPPNCFDHLQKTNPALSMKTPLHMACMQGHYDIAAILLEAGANPRLADGSGRDRHARQGAGRALGRAGGLGQRALDRNHPRSSRVAIEPVERAYRGTGVPASPVLRYGPSIRLRLLGPYSARTETGAPIPSATPPVFRCGSACRAPPLRLP